jgi:hypothetical protein
VLAALIFLEACGGDPSHVELLASIKADAPGQAWPLEAADYRQLGESLFGPGQHVVVTPISDLSATEASIFDETTASDSLLGDNPMQIQEKAKATRERYYESISQLEARRSGHSRTEILSAIVMSASRFQDDSPRADKVLVILSTGFEQSGNLNMGDATLSLRAATAAILSALHHRNLVPDLHGVKVCMAGVTAGERGWADSNSAFAIRSFWNAYFQDAGARLIAFGPSLSSTCLSAIHRIDLMAAPGSN